MAKSNNRTYSRQTREAAKLLSQLIRLARIERKITAQDLADRAGISRGMLQRIEKGDLRCEFGVVFELATLVGIRLFDAGLSDLATYVSRTEEKLTLLPKHVRKNTKIDDDF